MIFLMSEKRAILISFWGSIRTNYPSHKGINLPTAQKAPRREPLKNPRRGASQQGLPLPYHYVFND